ncbi:hypothetical protein BYT27DRAFT_7149933 [Phlegmacium glaucopus]|nr:hypothetical protein BYT27DRAFT_7149933 [Phlegmacium glaucopus]
MFSVSRYNISGSKSTSQLTSGNIDDIAFNLSALRASLGYKSFHQTPRSLSQHNASLLINQLPIELLCDIFSKFLEDDREHPDYTPASGPLVSFYTRADPTILGQVCSWWRRVALSTPALWSNIFLSQPSMSQISRIHLWLRRAGNNSLNLAVEEPRERGEYDANALHRIFSALIPRLELWKTVEFLLPANALGSLAAIANRPMKCQKLESASLQLSAERRQDRASTKLSIDAIWRVFHSSPVLRRVGWWGVYSGEISNHAPWATITHVVLEHEFEVGTLIDLLSLCPHIQDISIFRLSISTTDVHKSNKALVLDKLHAFTLDAEVETGPLFQRLTLPSLRSLSIHHRYVDEHFPRNYSEFQSLLARSRCSLERFILYDHNIAEVTLNGYLRSPYLRSVKYLEVQGSISDLVTSSLTNQGDDGYHKIMLLLEDIKVQRAMDRFPR